MKKLYTLFIGLAISITSYSQSSDQNYIMTTVYKQAHTNVANVPENDKKTSITYFDGLGNPIETINHNQSASGKDILQHFEYDAFGRAAKTFLPFSNGSSSLNYQAINAENVSAFYNGSNDYPATGTPYSEKQFEASPLNRILKQAAPGDDWKLGSGHEVKFKYQSNAVGEVKRFLFKLDYSAATRTYEPIGLQLTGYYPANRLYKNVTIDENNALNGANNTQEFKNKQGQVVLKRTKTTTEQMDTYYLYDVYGNLTYVIPPKAASLTLTASVLDNLCYQYKYDKRNRLVDKKIPGKSWEYLVYDKLDRVRATGPAQAPFTNLQGQTGWLFTKYDPLGRPILTAWQAATVNQYTRVQLDNAINTSGTNSLSESRNHNTTVLGVTFSYTNHLYPTANYHILTLNYYDDYNYYHAPTPPTQVLGQHIRNGQNGNCKGLSTGSWVRILTQSSNTDHKLSYAYYKDDRMASPVVQKTTYPNDGFIRTASSIDFEGKTLKTYTRHHLDNSHAVEYEEEFRYSNQGRLLTASHNLYTNPIETIVHNRYKELGELQSKGVGGTPNHPLQTVDYNYNIRGWLTAINDVSNLQDDLFAFKISYNQPDDATALYNGNISETFWRSSNDNNERKYSYRYDPLNRLKNAYYKNLSNGFGGTYNVNLTYDKNGNIQTLNRKGGAEAIYTPTIDNLKYFYANNSNLLKKVVDLTNNPNGFKDDSNGTIASDTENDYRYDQYGNMTADQNKQIERIRYNHLNLPTEIVFTNDRLIRYTYDASGAKMKKVAVSPSSENVTLYRDGFQYSKRNNEALKLQFFPTAEGYVKAVYEGTSTSPRFQYVYNYTDHLGNIRLQYAKMDGLRIMEEDNYYPFGLKHARYNQSMLVCMRKPISGKKTTRMVYSERSYKYKYNGKELQDEFGLNMYDYGARNYDAALGRWFNVDPLAEYYYSLSPYNYVGNDPVTYLDPDGNFRTKFGAMWHKLWHGGEGIGHDKGGEYYVYTDSATDDNEGGVTITSTRIFDKDGRNKGKDLKLEAQIEDYITQLRFEKSMNDIGYETYYTDDIQEARMSMLKLPAMVTMPNIIKAATNTARESIEVAAETSTVAAKSSSKVLNFTTRQLQAKFKHAADFGIKGNWNKAAAGKFNSAINQHINSAGIKSINGTYRGQSVIHSLNPNTGLNVISSPSGQFISGWKLNPTQLQNVLQHGGL